MMRSLATPSLALLLLLGASTPVLASPCGGGSSSGSSGGSSGSSSGGSSGGSSSSSSSGCTDATSIIGRTECSRFGTWDRQLFGPMRWSMAFTGGTSSVSGMHLAGEVTHDQVHDYHLPTAPNVRNTPERFGMGGFEIEGTAFVTDKLHLGLHTGFALGAGDGASSQVGELTLRSKSVVQLSTAGVIGLSIPLGSWQVRSDTLIGLRSTNVSIESQQGSCIQQVMAWNNQLMLEPRVGIDKWISPWLSAGIMVGSDLMQADDLTIAIGITGHTTPRDNAGVVGLLR